MKFNSQICTTREQSERLLSLGLKKETADMVHYRSSSMKEWGILATPWGDDCEGCKCYYPAWSLHRLIEMRLAHDSFVVFQLSNTEDAFEKVISHIEHAIKEGYFNKEYLEE